METPSTITFNNQRVLPNLMEIRKFWQDEKNENVNFNLMSWRECLFRKKQ